LENSLSPKQDRSLKTQRALIAAFVALLEEKPFEEITVAQIAGKAGLTTGAIYRRFKDKRALLENAFEGFVAESIANQDSRAIQTRGKSDREIIETLIRSTLEFTIPYLPLMRAASSLNDQPSFESMRKARNITSDWLAEQISTSPYTEEDLKHRTRFAMRVITAVFRDTLLAGPGADTKRTGHHGRAIERMVKDLTEMTVGYLEIDR